MPNKSAVYWVGAPGQNERFFSFEDLYDIYVFDGDDGRDFMATYGGDDIVKGGLGRDFINTQSGDDTIYGDRFATDEATSADANLAADADVINGGAGNDTIFAGGGNNYVNGGSDADYIMGGAGNEMLLGGYDNDEIYGGSGNDMLYGGTTTNAAQVVFIGTYFGDFSTNFEQPSGTARTVSYDTSLGAGGLIDDLSADLLDGGAGNDLIDGGAGPDILIGGVGNDRIYVDDAFDFVVERVGEGVDTVLAATSYTLKGGVEVERLSTTNTGAANAINLAGNTFAQQILGNQGGNKLLGYGGNDQILGYGGNDIIYGGLGADRLSGGLGNDVFVFDTALGAGNIDVILDFHTVAKDDDTIRIDNAIFSKLGNSGPLNGVFFAANSAGLANDSNDFIVYNTATGALYYDSNGSASGGAVQFAVVSGHPPLTAADFVVI